jgi:hypothetical protein
MCLKNNDSGKKGERNSSLRLKFEHVSVAQYTDKVHIDTVAKGTDKYGMDINYSFTTITNA